MEDDSAAARVNLPVWEKDPSPQDWVKWLTLVKATLMLNGAVELLNEALNAALPATEAGAANGDTISAVKRHRWALAAMAISMQKNPSSSAAIADTEALGWSSGQMSGIYANLVQELSLEGDTGGVAKDSELDATPSFGESEDPQVLLDAIANVVLLYQNTSTPGAGSEKRKHLVRKLPQDYAAALVAEMRAVPSGHNRAS